jgi:antitoxin component HigA of HigAB toxin-antitoxin module
MTIGTIKSKSDHEAALREIEALWGAKEGSPEGDRLDVLATLVEAYEASYFEERARRADYEWFDRFMNREGGEPPRAGDELPPGYKRRK